MNSNRSNCIFCFRCICSTFFIFFSWAYLGWLALRCVYFIYICFLLSAHLCVRVCINVIDFHLPYSKEMTLHFFFPSCLFVCSNSTLHMVNDVFLSLSDVWVSLLFYLFNFHIKNFPISMVKSKCRCSMGIAVRYATTFFVNNVRSITLLSI